MSAAAIAAPTSNSTRNSMTSSFAGHWLGAAAPLVRAAPSNSSRLCLDRRARGRDDPPGSAEVDEALAVDVAGLLVLGEEVERVASVGDLQLPVPTLRRAQQGGLQARANGRPGGHQWRPEGRALSVASARFAFVMGEQIERPP